MAKQTSNKNVDKQDTVNQFEDSQDMRADLDVGQTDTRSFKETPSAGQSQATGRLQEDRNPRRNI